MDHCVICKKHIGIDPKATSVLGHKGANSLNQASGVENRFVAGQKVHVTCRRDFCRDSTRKGAEDNPKIYESTIVRRRSTMPKFAWSDNCLFCGNTAKYEGRKRGFIVIPVRTIDFQESITESCTKRNDVWAECVLGRLESVCDLPAVNAVYHQQCSVNFRTGKQVPSQFASNNVEDNPMKKSRFSTGRPLNDAKTKAFFKIVEYLESNEDEITTISDLCTKMTEHLQVFDKNEEAYSVKYMKVKLEEHFGDEIVITHGGGSKSSIVMFKRSATSIINEFYQMPNPDNYDIEKERIIKTAAQLIKYDIRNIENVSEYYPCAEEMSSIDKAMNYIPETLNIFLSLILTGKDIKLKTASLGQALVQGARPRSIIAPLQLALGIQMHHHFSSKFLIDTLNALGFCSSYTTVKNFERSAAVSQGTDIPGYEAPGGFIQHIADNVDHNVRTLDGLGTFHGMGIIAAISPGTMSSRPVPKKSVSKEDIALAGRLDIMEYKGPCEPITSLIYKDLENMKLKDASSHLNLLYNITLPIMKSPRPAWSGTMQMIFKGVHPCKSSILFLPMIDMDPGNMTCIFSTLSFILRQAKQYHATPIITFDQPLWWKALTIILNEPQDSAMRSIVLRLGGLHIQMSFLGCIGHLMARSGLEDVLELVYAKTAVSHMLSGKAVARAIRGHFLVDAALNSMLVKHIFNIPSITESDEQLQGNQEEEIMDVEPSEEGLEQQDIHQEEPDGAGLQETVVTDSSIGNTLLEEANRLYEKLMNEEIGVQEACSSPVCEVLSDKIDAEKMELKKRRTAALWLQYMDMVDILRRFIKAERTGNWQLHLQCVFDMLPFFAAAGHNLYAKSAYIYIQIMRDLKETHPVVYQSFEDGLHVIRRSDRCWAGISTDLAIEQVLMRSVKTSGGLTRGRGMDETQRTVWLLSMPACADVNNALQSLTDVNYLTSEQHKDTTIARQTRDFQDFKTISNYLPMRNPFSDDPALRNITSGVVADPNVNVDNAKEVGESILSSMVGKDIMHYSFSRKAQAITLASKISVSSSMGAIQVDPQMLFQRLSVVATSGRFENPQDLFQYEMCSYPPALFESSLLPRQANKPVLADALWNKTKQHCCGVLPANDDAVYVLDGGALLHRIPWPKTSTYNDVMSLYVQYVRGRYHNVTVIFDGYPDAPSTKDATHHRRSVRRAPTTTFDGSMHLHTSKEVFLSNKTNKQRFIMHLAEKLSEAGCNIIHASGDADYLIIQTAVELARENETLVIGDDTDLLVLLLFHVQFDSHDIFFAPEVRHKSGSRRIWNIQKAKQALGQNICKNILFIHAILGCDTTSRLYGIGKCVGLKKMQDSIFFCRQAHIFLMEDTPVEDIIKAGEKAVVSMYGGGPNDSLDGLRYIRFCQKVSSGKTFLQPENLPPTSAAIKYHSMRVYYQVQEWSGNQSLQPTCWGWRLTDGQFSPMTTDLPAAHKSLLDMIRCNCKLSCSSQRCSCRKHGLECSPACGVCRGSSCLNSPAPDLSTEDDV